MVNKNFILSRKRQNLSKTIFFFFLCFSSAFWALLALSKGGGIIQDWGMLKEPCKVREQVKSKAVDIIAFLTFVKYYKIYIYILRMMCLDSFLAY